MADELAGLAGSGVFVRLIRQHTITGENNTHISIAKEMNGEALKIKALLAERF